MAETENSSPTLTKSDDQPAESHLLPLKKKRSLPGMPDPDAEVIALSPKTLLATNRFVCEICSKGFQRDQNLQLHRRGHNLPWKLRQRTNKEMRKRVYVCPEAGCIHHDPSRALGDLTGIKKHFCRKHGEKKYKCDRCSKRYAVQSDCKAHMKTCGTREYRCDCGTVFSRRDSFITHRAFCDALAQESARSQPQPQPKITASPPAASSPPPLTPSVSVLSPVLSIQSPTELPENQNADLPPPATGQSVAALTTAVNRSSSPNSNGGAVSSTSNSEQQSYSSLLSLSSSLFPSATAPYPQLPPHYMHLGQPALSATALLQKAAQMGATTSSDSSFLRGLGLSSDHPTNWNNSPVAGGLIMSNKPATVDFLGLGMEGGEAEPGGFSAFLSSISGGRINVAATFAGLSSGVEEWDETSDGMPSGR